MSGGKLLRPGILIVLLAIAVYCALVFAAEAEALSASLKSIGTVLLLVLLAISSSNFLFRYIRWHHYLAKVGIRVAPFESLIVFLSGFSMTLTPAKAGEILKSLMLKRTHGVVITYSAPIILAERVSDLCGLMLLIGLGALALPYGGVILAMIVVGVALIAWICASDLVARFVLRLLERVPLVRKAVPTLERLVPTLATLSQPRTFAYGLVLALLAWGMQCLTLYIAANNILAAPISVEEGLLIYAAPLVAGNLASLPGGLGVSEGSMTGMLVHFGGQGTSIGEAAAITLIVRALSLWWGLLVGYISLIYWRIRFASGPAMNGETTG
ncbi:MAG: flippase-like domain-containing protein [Silicimonas sp.]|nr:flippase-like domain-containing protein [Silicimonas sp.]